MDSKQRLSLTLIELSDARRCKMKKSLYKIGAAVFVAVFVAASFGFSTQAAEKKMTKDEPIETIDITFKFDRATGRLIGPQGKHKKNVVTVPDEKMIEIYKEEGFRYVVTFIHAHSSPGCTYWYDYAIGSWVAYCWPQ
jgi:hypothetical protein